MRLHEPRAFRLRTEEGSTFLVRFDESEDHPDQGVLQIGGRARNGQMISMRGVGFLPEPGGEIIVDSEPEEEYYFRGEKIVRYPRERIASVEEIPLPQQ